MAGWRLVFEPVATGALVCLNLLVAILLVLLLFFLGLFVVLSMVWGRMLLARSTREHLLNGSPLPF